jgi:uridine kinase
MEDKLALLKHSKNKNLKLYNLCGRYDYFYGQMAYSTGIIGEFEIMYYKPGFILRYPTIHEPKVIPKFNEQKKLAKIFRETEIWGTILNVANVGSLNDIVVSGEMNEMAMITEAFHEKKIANIADQISLKEKVKIVLIAGPSSSGKTTFTKRLGIQLRVNGLIPIQISLDDYFINRDQTPKDEDGNYDFESIYALDLELFNNNLTELLKGEKVKLPRYDFLTGKRVWSDKEIYIPERGVLLIEGIHGLNEILTSSIDKENKFKIYISALTQLNLDNHNRIATTDVRIIRRIVRDYLSRGYKAEDTLKMWHSIKKGEEKNIFPFQEEADVMFNSTLVYELCVLKKYALPELKKISEESSVYYEAKRLISFLNFFKTVDEEVVPRNSILKEFIGGSIFYKY